MPTSARSESISWAPSRDAIVDCSITTATFNCTAANAPTLADAQDANAIRDTATIGELDPVIDRTFVGGKPLPIAQIVTLLVNRDALSLSSIPVDQLGILQQNPTGDDSQAALLSYAPAGIDFVEDPVVTIVLPPGTSFAGISLVEPSAADYTYEITGTESSGQTVAVRFPPSPTGEVLAINAGEALKVTVYYRVGLRMGPVRLPSVDVAAAGAHQRDLNVSPNRITDNLFDTGPALADAEDIVPTVRAAAGNEVQEGELAFVFLEDKADDQLLRIPAPPGWIHPPSRRRAPAGRRRRRPLPAGGHRRAGACPSLRSRRTGREPAARHAPGHRAAAAMSPRPTRSRSSPSF